jgi:FAD/FMN-containing dehydrogenase/Fe-S oxidoreductase
MAVREQHKEARTDPVLREANAAARAALVAALPKLSRALAGEVRADALARAIYATDASNNRMVPLGVVVPRTRADVEAAVAIAAEHKIPLLPRGGGTSLAGNTVGAALVVDFSKYMHRILDVDPAGRRVRVEPGVIVGRLNRALAAHGLLFGPDPATKDRAALGGMIGNNSCGAHSLAYGKTVDHVERVVALLADGSLIEAARSGEVGGSERARGIAAALRMLAAEVGDLVRARYPQIPRRVSGFNLDELLSEHGANVAGLLTGSEGTLAVTLEATLALSPRPRHRALTLLFFDDVPEALDQVPELVQRHAPAALELVDRTLITRAEVRPRFHRALRLFDAAAGGTILVEAAGESAAEVAERARAIGRERFPGLRATAVLIDHEEQEEAWALRESALGLLWNVRGAAKPTAGVEDTAVPPSHLGRYVREFRDVLRRHGTEGSFYGHAGEGCLHIRVLLDLKAAGGPAGLRRLTEEVGDLVLAHGGSLSGEHGDGIARSELLGRMFGAEIVQAFGRVKALFDPERRLNPGKIVDPLPLDSNLRFHPDYSLQEPATFFDWSQQEGFGRAVENCIGVGKCRKLDAGTMCPSYMVTLDEQHSTRGRANALREAMLGELLGEGGAGIGDPRLREALDLCLSCKACKRECPTGVDMARLKAEVLAAQRLQGGAPLHHRMYAAIGRLSAMGAAAPWLGNGIARSGVGGWLIRAAGRIHPGRSLPTLAPESFRARFARSTPRPPEPGRGQRVILLDDTFNNYQEPQVLASAADVLAAAGFEVALPATRVCCGRPFYSLGFLDRAREAGRHLLEVLGPEIDRGTLVVGCEPSCLLTFRDELPDLVSGPRSRALARQARLLEELLVATDFAPGRLAGQAIVHPHCHQLALAGSDALMALLRRVDGLTCELLDSGCCGMAGAFGYERDHYAVSMAIGERVLLPRVRAAAAETLLVANGTSCRHQIRDGARREAIHVAELLARCERQAMIARTPMPRTDGERRNR